MTHHQQQQLQHTFTHAVVKSTKDMPPPPPPRPVALPPCFLSLSASHAAHASPVTSRPMYSRASRASAADIVPVPFLSKRSNTTFIFVFFGEQDDASQRFLLSDHHQRQADRGLHCYFWVGVSANQRALGELWEALFFTLGGCAVRASSRTESAILRSARTHTYSHKVAQRQ